MKYLYEVIVINSNNEAILMDRKLVASTREESLISADVKNVLTKEITLDDISVLVVELGSVKEKEKIKKVKVVK